MPDNLSPASVMAQAKKNLAKTGSMAPKKNLDAKPTMKASKPKLPAQNQKFVNQQKKINKTSMW